MFEMLELDITNHLGTFWTSYEFWVYMYIYIYNKYIYIYVIYVYIYIFYFFAIIQNRSIVYGTGHFITEGNSFIIYTYILYI